MSLVAHWPLNGNTLDYSGNGFHGTKVGILNESDNGKIGKTYLFENNNNGIDIKNNFSYLKEYTFSIWVYPLGSHKNYNGSFISSGNWNGKSWNFGLSQNNTHIDLAGRGYNKLVSYEVPLNKWTHIVCSGKNDKIKLYVNGVFISESNYSTTLNSDSIYSCIGRETYASGHFSFNGKLNDLKIFNHELSKKEIDELYKTKILDWKFNECEEPTVNLIKNNYSLRKTNHGLHFSLIEEGVNYKKYSISGTYSNDKYPYTFSITGPTNAKRDKRQSISFQLESNCFNKFTSDFGANIVNINWKPGRKYELKKENNIYYYKVENIAPDTTANGEICDNYTDLIYINSMALSTTVFNPQEDWIIVKNYQLEEKTYSTEFTPNERPGKIIDSSGYKNHGLATLVNTPKWDNKKFIFNGAGNFITSTTKLLSSNEQCWTMIARIKLYGLSYPQHLNDFNLGCRIVHNADAKALNYLNSGANDLYRYSKSSLEINKEYEVAFVYNHKTRRIDFYLNGVLDNGNCVLNTVELTKNPAGIKAITKFFEGFNGECSRIRVFARDLTSEEIKNEYQNSLVFDKNKNVYCSELVLKPNSTMGLTKQGQLLLTDIQEISNKQPVLFEQKELNGKLYGLIFYHNCVGGTILFDNNKENFLNCNEENKKSLLSELEKFRINGKFEFLLEYDELKNQYNNWEQTSNPTETQEIEGYKELNCSWKQSNWNGIALSSSIGSTWIDGSPKVDTWFYAIGCRSKYANGMPTNNLSTSTWVKLWVRLNNSIEITKNNNLICNEIREV